MIEVDLDALRQRMEHERIFTSDVHELLDYVDTLKTALEKEKTERETCEKLLADLQGHSELWNNGYQKGLKDGRDESYRATYDLREAFGKMVSEAIWQAMLGGGICSQQSVDLLRKVKEEALKLISRHFPEESK